MKIFFLLIIALGLQANIIDFYKKAVSTLQYKKEFVLHKKANSLSKEGLNKSRYENFSFSVDYTKTKVISLSKPFGTTNITFSDDLDIFNKNGYKITLLALDIKSKKYLLNIQKEKLFISLANMVAIYDKALDELSLYKKVLKKQKKIFSKLKKLEKIGAISSLEILRFKNELISLELAKTNQENEIAKMKKELNLYAPKEPIPILKEEKLNYHKKDFLKNNPYVKLNNIEVKKLLTKAKGLKESFLPDVSGGVTYQQNGDPTSFGNNYSFFVNLKIPLNMGNSKEIEAIKTKALSLKSKNISYQIERKTEFISRYQDYISASKQLKILQNSLKEFEKSKKNIENAYLKHYIDFNVYYQTFMQELNMKRDIIKLRYEKRLQAAILNAVGLGAIYE